MVNSNEELISLLNEMQLTWVVAETLNNNSLDYGRYNVHLIGDGLSINTLKKGQLYPQEINSQYKNTVEVTEPEKSNTIDLNLDNQQNNAVYLNYEEKNFLNITKSGDPQSIDVDQELIINDINQDNLFSPTCFMHAMINFSPTSALPIRLITIAYKPEPNNNRLFIFMLYFIDKSGKIQFFIAKHQETSVKFYILNLNTGVWVEMNDNIVILPTIDQIKAFKLSNEECFYYPISSSEWKINNLYNGFFLNLNENRIDTIFGDSLIMKCELKTNLPIPSTLASLPPSISCYLPTPFTKDSDNRNSIMGLLSIFWINNKENKLIKLSDVLNEAVESFAGDHIFLGTDSYIPPPPTQEKEIKFEDRTPGIMLFSDYDEKYKKYRSTVWINHRNSKNDNSESLLNIGGSEYAWWRTYLQSMSITANVPFKGSMTFRPQINSDKYNYFYPGKYDNTLDINNENAIIFDMDLMSMASGGSGSGGIIPEYTLDYVDIDFIFMGSHDESIWPFSSSKLCTKDEIIKNVKLFYPESLTDSTMYLIDKSSVTPAYFEGLDTENICLWSVKYRLDLTKFTNNYPSVLSITNADIIAPKTNCEIIDWLYGGSEDNYNENKIDPYNPFSSSKYKNVETGNVFESIDNCGGSVKLTHYYYQITCKSSAKYLFTNPINIPEEHNGKKLVLVIGGFSCFYTNTQIWLQIYSKNSNDPITVNPYELQDKYNNYIYNCENIPVLSVSEGKNFAENIDNVFLKFELKKDIDRIRIVMFMENNDSNNSCYCDKVRIYLSKLCLGYEETNTDVLFNYLDKNDDGLVDITEWKHYINTTFKLIDTNNDTVLSYDELAAVGLDTDELAEVGLDNDDLFIKSSGADFVTYGEWDKLIDKFDSEYKDFSEFENFINEDKFLTALTASKINNNLVDNEGSGSY